ncbi:MAG TPA: hypothetical protein VFM93_09760 [Candidatus Limnocylindria bacterium]|nr:hypothetical protein [Candidatus Limnocylindria bacterium]
MTLVADRLADRARLRSFVVGLVAGALAGVGFLIVPIVAIVIPLMLLWALWVLPRLPKLSGLLVGAGIAILTALAVAQQRCLAQGSSASAGCVPPDVSGFLLSGGALIVAGIAFAVLSFASRKDAHT